MKFYKALKLLSKKKVEHVKCETLSMYGQDMESLVHWMCCGADEESRKKFVKQMMKAKWEVES